MSIFFHVTHIGGAEPADQDEEIIKVFHVSINQLKTNESSETVTHLTCSYSCNFLVAVCLSSTSFMVGNGCFNTRLYII